MAITDANLVLGRLIPSSFPHIFGPNADEPLDVNASYRKFEALTAKINKELSQGQAYTVDQVAAGFIRIASESSADVDDENPCCTSQD